MTTPPPPIPVPCPSVTSPAAVPNPEADMARAFIHQTNRHLFLTGRAGTGKTTFLHQLRKESAKQLAVVAPTGVAAINARGVTIHSLFQLPFGLLTPARLRREVAQKRLRKEKARLLQGLDLLVIDEISMVRADVLDAIDYILRRYRRNNQPFGGVQLLLIGDLQQLPPVVKNEEAEALFQHYSTAFFFGAKALQRAGLVTIELKHIYRQSDRIFIELLNKVRRNQINKPVLAQLNARHRQGYRPPDGDGTITLTSHRQAADRTNAARLAALATAPRSYAALIEGTFPESMYPTDEKLTLKVGAQVMFIKNDRDKRYYNGKIGQVSAIDEKTVTVSCPDGMEIQTVREEWTNQKFRLDERTKAVKETVVGTFQQFPLRLAWAVTIHKSQGLTFDKVVIDAAAAFAHGQVYVALSRCRTLEGITLSSRIAQDSVRTDDTVDRYTRQARKTAPDQAALAAAKADYRRSLISSLFDFTALRTALEQLRRLAHEKRSAWVARPAPAMEILFTDTQAKLFDVARKFAPALRVYLDDYDYSRTKITLSGKPRKAVDYFEHQLTSTLTQALDQIDWRTDHQGVKAQLEERSEALQRALRVKVALLKLARNAFTDTDFVRTRTRAELGDAPASPDFRQVNQQRRQRTRQQHLHPHCLEALETWRHAQARQEGVKAHRIIATRAMDAIAAALPLSTRELLRVAGIGTQKTATYGEAILRVVQAYCKSAAITDAQRGRPPALLVRPIGKTTARSIQLFREGKPVDEIARLRQLTPGTIYNHLAKAVARGELPIRRFVTAADQAAIEALLEAAPLTVSLSDIKARAKDRFAYHQLRMVRTAWLLRQPNDQLAADG